MRKIILKNRRKNEKLELTKEEFKIKFNKELNQAINTYKAHNKSFLPEFCKKGPTEQDFWFSLRFNFNNYAICEYYIENIR